MNREYKPMYCPVCGKFYFPELQDGDDPEDFQCLLCGWKYSPSQIDAPDEPDKKNGKSLNAYKEWYNNELAKNPGFIFWDGTIPAPVPHYCPVCGKYQFKDEDSYDICPICGWEDDSSEKDPDDVGANDISFNEYREMYRKKTLENPDYRWKSGK